eukprot:208090-Pyramimonas_sp.AAC.1
MEQAFTETPMDEDVILDCFDEQEHDEVKAAFKDYKNNRSCKEQYDIDTEAPPISVATPPVRVSLWSPAGLPMVPLWPSCAALRRAPLWCLAPLWVPSGRDMMPFYGLPISHDWHGVSVWCPRGAPVWYHPGIPVSTAWSPFVVSSWYRVRSPDGSPCGLLL